MKPPTQRPWEGDPKGWRKECTACQYRVEIDETSYCGWGVLFKTLVQVEKPTRCDLLKRTPTSRSVGYLIAFKQKVEQQRTAYVFAFRDEGVHLGIQVPQEDWGHTITQNAEEKLVELAKSKRLYAIQKADELPLEHTLEIVIPMPDRLQKIVSEAHQSTCHQ
ncbi:MAG: hypothetical protein QF486_06495 [Candidatus Woesearchaeota archaeon]|jgi:hypothetical protein|nr:hypothetical protein [Candidatus Woesearchaeota archaeon]MDP7181921.1 hypothetical protein [Candidatus Woesearchaeota archaeon]MDP7199236.1 hypothetical protein [Candidatus Woesearchaeota archaeon]MDP7467849.1 hypothetical protein [Candidatus Woesearchaeota archaeon]MDP7647839.1 hypothetical protein [Candidatus Woesearchaeota archaeon]